MNALYWRRRVPVRCTGKRGFTNACSRSASTCDFPLIWRVKNSLIEASGASGSTNLPETKDQTSPPVGGGCEAGSKGQIWTDEQGEVKQYCTTQSQEDGEQLLNDLHKFAT